jgi:hypothetical protein
VTAPGTYDNPVPRNGDMIAFRVDNKTLLGNVRIRDGQVFALNPDDKVEYGPIAAWRLILRQRGAD